MKNIKTAITMVLVLSILFIFCNECFAIRIGLLTSQKKVYVATSQDGMVFDGYNNKPLLKTASMTKYYIKKYKNKLAIKQNDQYYNLNTSYAIIKPNTQDGFVSTKNKWYRGMLLVFNDGKGVTVVNDLDIESYIRGVVPAEMPASWNTEAHKAQAIAARSYAIANSGKRGSKGYDLKDTPEDQAYGGASAETPKTNYAVNKTKGLVLTHKGKVIPAYYHASSGGHTLSASRVWGMNLPYIKPVPAFDNHISKNGHGIGMSQHGANQLANKGYNAYQILNYFYSNIGFGQVNK